MYGGKDCEEIWADDKQRNLTLFSLPTALFIADCWLTLMCGLVCTRHYGAKSLVYKKKGKKLYKITVILTWAMSTVGWRWCLWWSLTAAREKCIRADFWSQKKANAVFSDTLDLQDSISKNKHIKTYHRKQTREVKMMLIMLTNFISIA